jgi:hypothetical protein
VGYGANGLPAAGAHARLLHPHGELNRPGDGDSTDLTRINASLSKAEVQNLIRVLETMGDPLRCMELVADFIWVGHGNRGRANNS